jgi:hypothetical protein
MLRFPLELLQAIFHYLNFKELVRAQAVCRQWQQIILDSWLWPSSIYMTSRWQSLKVESSTGSSSNYRIISRWNLFWPDGAAKEKELCVIGGETTCQVLWTISKGSTKSLSIIQTTAPEGIFDVLPNFVSLVRLRLRIPSISSRELTSILQSAPQITTFVLYVNKFHGMPRGRLKIIRLKLRRLSIRADRRDALHNTMANIVQHCPDLISLAVKGTMAKKELTMKLGDGIQCLSLSVDHALPPISCKGLKCLSLDVNFYKIESYESRLCDLSYLTHLQLYSYSTKADLSLMEAYNIGENLKFLRLDASPQPEVLLRAPKLKVLRLHDLRPSMPLHVCPALRIIQCGCGFSTLTTSERDEMKRQLESQGYIVTYLARIDGSSDIEKLATCAVCGRSHD